jgi:lon-related putative ATP-dependent protease
MTRTRKEALKRMEVKELRPEELRRTCDPAQFRFKSTAELAELSEIIGQERATRAIDFGIEMPCPGYNIYALGPAGSGRATVIKEFLQRKAAAGTTPDSWGYVNNFEDAYQPRALRLPPDKGCAIRDEMDSLLEYLEEELPRAFESEQYQEHFNALGRRLEEARTAKFKGLEARMIERGFALLRTPMGLVIAPVLDGEVLSREQYEQLPAEKKSELEEHRPELQGALDKTLREVRLLEREAKNELRKLDQETAAFTIGHHFESMRKEYADVEGLLQFLDTVQKDILAKVEQFKRKSPSSDSGSGPGEDGPLALMARFRKSPFDKYRINVIVDSCELEGAPVVQETNPTYHNLIGRIEHRAEFGTLVTDYSAIRGGALHAGNGGYLILDVLDLLRNPLAWEGLKRALRNQEIKIEELTQQLGLMATATLAPEPIPLDVKVVLIGDPTNYYLLYNLDEDFQELFKVKADFAADMDWSSDNLEKVALFVHDRCQDGDLKHFELGAVAKIVEHAARLVEDQEKLSTRFGLITDAIHEASYWAGRNGHELVTAEDVQGAVQEKVYRANQIEEKLREQIDKGVIMVDTEGAVIGQVNGLSIISLGDYYFGRPSRITAQTFMGRAGVINIEREAKMSGNIHDKGVMILAGYMGGKYAQDKPLNLSASICFEQSYGAVDGDSASSTELYALLSSLSGLPIRQGIAVTGSVNQRGEVQAVGGVTKKIEGFYDVCRIKGLSGEQGVIIPKQNVKTLMVREDVVESVREGKFHIYSVGTIDEGIEILTGRPAGERQEDGSYTEGTVNRLVDEQLRDLAVRLRAFGKKGEEENANEES